MRRRSLRRELSGVAQGVGVMPQAEVAQVLVLSEDPGFTDQADDRVGQPRGAIRGLGGVLGDVSGDGRVGDGAGEAREPRRPLPSAGGASAMAHR
jgi:hypothetical protein